MSKKVIEAHCSDCPLAAKKFTLVRNSGPKNPKLIVLGEGPSFTDAIKGTPFMGESGRLIRSIIRNAGLNPVRDVYYMNITLCWPIKSGNNITAIPLCEGHLIVTLQGLPDVPVVALGRYAQQALGLVDQDYLQREKHTGKWAIATFHPAVLKSNPTKLINIESAFHKALSHSSWTHAEYPGKNYILNPYNLPDLNQHWHRICVDIETTSTDWRHADIFLVGIAFDTGERLIFTRQSLQTPQFQAWLRALFAHHGKVIGGHNFRYDSLCLNRQFNTRLVVGWDTMAMACVIHEQWYKGLKDLARFWLNAQDWEEDLVKTGLQRCEDQRKKDLVELRQARHHLRLKRPTQEHMAFIEKVYAKYRIRNLDEILTKIDEVSTRKFNYSDVDGDIMHEYLACDIDYNLQLSYVLEAQLKATGKWDMPYEGHEIPQMNMLIQVERNGFAVDLRHAAKLADDIRSQMNTIQAIIAQKSEGVLQNPNSHAQVRTYLFETLGRKPTLKTASGAWSVNESVLEEHKDDPIIAAVLYYRRIAKLVSSYLENLDETCTIDKMGVIRCNPSYRPEKTVTHRLSAEDPPIQTIPKKDSTKDTAPAWLAEYGITSAGDWGELIKQVYVAPPGMVLLRADGKGWELWVAVALCAIFGVSETYLESVINTGGDPHSQMCDDLWGKGWTKAQRTLQKNVYFGTQYRGLPYAIHMETGIPLETVERIQRELLKKLVGLPKLWDILYKMAVTDQLITLPFFNYDVHFDLVTNELLRQIEKNSINYPVQGIGSMIISRAAIKALPLLETLGAHIVALVHDDYTIEVPIDKQQLAAEIMVDSILSSARDFYPNLDWRVELTVGKNWGEMKEVRIEEL